jgi:hypothetical protein
VNCDFWGGGPASISSLQAICGPNKLPCLSPAWKSGGDHDFKNSEKQGVRILAVPFTLNVILNALTSLSLFLTFSMGDEKIPRMNEREIGCKNVWNTVGTKRIL